jgi:hypothetical protein
MFFDHLLIINVYYFIIPGKTVSRLRNGRIYAFYVFLNKIITCNKHFFFIYTLNS